MDIKKDFIEYVKKYAEKHEITIEEALTHKMVKDYREWLAEGDK